MTPKPKLEDLRAEIDAIDDQLHDLFMRRAKLAAQVLAAKGDGPIMRPGREAEILRRLLDRHSGDLPYEVIAHIWRELISAFLRLEDQLEVAVYGAADRIRIWDMARFHYGAVTEFTACKTAGEALDTVAHTRGAAGVLALEDDAEEPWWITLKTSPEAGLRVVACLPFLSQSSAPEAFVITKVDAEPSGNDTTLIVLEDGKRIPDRGLVVAEAKGYRLVGVPGFSADDEDAIGAYANPIKMESGE